jgi:enoyl-CoA hydratase/carnithine racemase
MFMLGEAPAELIKHLSHPNGWWRDEAQKLIVLKGEGKNFSAGFDFGDCLRDNRSCFQAL